MAQAKRVRLEGDDPVEATLRIAETMPDQVSSTAQDIARGRRTEIDDLNGYVVRQSDALGLPAPVNRTLHALGKLLEGSPRSLSS